MDCAMELQREPPRTISRPHFLPPLTPAKNALMLSSGVPPSSFGGGMSVMFFGTYQIFGFSFSLRHCPEVATFRSHSLRWRPPCAWHPSYFSAGSAIREEINSMRGT